MPRPCGRDRLVAVKDGKLLLSCGESKGWRARSDAAGTSAEHPGTCVRWEDGLFEVEDSEFRADGGVTYTLRPWDERHAIRVVATYSPGSEAARLADVRDARRRVEGHTVVLVLAPVLGCLPARVQERLENEYNVRASWLSLASAVPLFLFGAFSVVATLIAALAGRSLLPRGALIAGQYLFVESALRIGVALMQGRGIGTAAGTALYEICRIACRGFDRVRGRRAPPEKSFFQVEPVDDRQGPAPSRQDTP